MTSYIVLECNVCGHVFQINDKNGKLRICVPDAEQVAQAHGWTTIDYSDEHFCPKHAKEREEALDEKRWEEE